MGAIPKCRLTPKYLLTCGGNKSSTQMLVDPFLYFLFLFPFLTEKIFNLHGMQYIYLQGSFGSRIVLHVKFYLNNFSDFTSTLSRVVYFDQLLGAVLCWRLYIPTSYWVLFIICECKLKDYIMQMFKILSLT